MLAIQPDTGNNRRHITPGSVQEMGTRSWEDERYEEVFEDTCASLEHRRKTECGFNIERLEAILKSLYNQEGNAWDGMSEIRHLTLQAMIAAHEHMLAEMKKAKN